MKIKGRKKRPVPTPPKVPAPKRIPGGRPLQPRYEKPEKPEGTTGAAPSKIELPPPKPGKTPDRSLSGHWVELGEPTQKKEEKPKVNVKKNLLAGTIAGLIAAGIIAGVFYSQGFFGKGGGGAQTWRITCEGRVATVTVDSSGKFSGSGWTGSTPSGSYSIPITDGTMYGTTMTFTANATYDSGQGTIQGTSLGTMNAPFPNATSASGTWAYTISDPLGIRSGSSNWTATRVS